MVGGTADGDFRAEMGSSRLRAPRGRRVGHAVNPKLSVIRLVEPVRSWEKTAEPAEGETVTLVPVGDGRGGSTVFP